MNDIIHAAANRVVAASRAYLSSKDKPTALKKLREAEAQRDRLIAHHNKVSV